MSQAQAVRYGLRQVRFLENSGIVAEASGAAGTGRACLRVRRDSGACEHNEALEVQAGKMTIEDCRRGKAMLDTMADWERYIERDPVLGTRNRPRSDPLLPVSAS